MHYYCINKMEYFSCEHLVAFGCYSLKNQLTNISSPEPINS